MKKALLVIDLQNDYLWEKRKPMFSYNTGELIKSVNQTIKKSIDRGYDIIYIAQVFLNIITNRWLIGFSIKGTEGAKLYSGLDILSDFYFEKNLSDAYSSKKFKAFMAEKKYDEIAICGLDECGCVSATAAGAVKTGASVTILKNSVASRFSEAKIRYIREKMLKINVKYK